MTLKYFASILILSIFLAACGGPVSTAPVVVTENPASPTQEASVPTPYPEPVVVVPEPTIPAYPEPVIPPSGYQPQPGDENQKRDQVFLELDNSNIVVTATEPSQVQANLQGNMSDPCHRLRVVVTPPDAQNTINLDVYSLVAPGVACMTVLKPFLANIPLGSYSSGEYVVMVNGQKLGEFSSLYSSQPGDEKLTRGEAPLDMTKSQLLITDQKPKGASAVLQGYLSDPCHQLRIGFTPADNQNNINLDVYSLYDPQGNCITVIQPFQVIYPLGSFPSGHYKVFVNGQLLGEFDG